MGERLSPLQTSVVQRTARNDLGWIPPEAMRFDLYKQD